MEYFEAPTTGNELDLYIKHTLKKMEKPLKSGIQYKFFEDNFFVLKNRGKYIIISSERELRKLLPEKEEEIRNFYKSYKALYKSDTDSFMTKLVKYLDGSKSEEFKP